jgi:hypothetical protein
MRLTMARIAMHLSLEKPEIVQDHLIFGYRLDNRGDEALFLRCLVADAHGLSEDLALDAREFHSAPTPELAYVTCAEPSCAAFLLGSSPCPDGAEPVVPLAIRIAPGRSFRAALRSRLPLFEWHGHLAPYQRPTETVAIERLSLVVEVVVDDERRARPDAAIAEAWHVRGGRTRHLRADADLSHPIPLLRRTDRVLRIEARAP